ncbi:MAG: leucyl aminopeptidase, partial [Chloroflexi bacterium]|nr:leucyl aminopeptidase [Chloroflexota bacterium]
MDWSVSTGDPLAAPVEALAVPVQDGDDPGAAARALDGALDGRLSALLRETAFRGRPGTVRTVYTFGQAPVRFLTLVGIGAASGDPVERVRLLAARAARSARDAGALSLALVLGDDAPVIAAARAAAEGVLLGTYRDTRFKAEKAADKRLERIHLVAPVGAEDDARAGIAAGDAVAAGVLLARDLVNQPGSDLWPDRLGAIAAAMAAEVGLECQIYGGEALATMGAGALLGVGKGSDHPPRLIHLRYRPAGVDGSAPITFVGKGITFETGGYNLKPGVGMETMKSDMAGAAAVLGAMKAVAVLRPAVAIDAVIASAENMVSGRSMRPGDILTAMNGTTIEVNNTDAEGRLVLADAVVFANQQGARQLIDLATLTGACVVALGTVCTGVMGQPQVAVDALLAAATTAGER